MMGWLEKRRSRIDPADVDKKADESLEYSAQNEDKVNVIIDFLQKRKNQNGFGEDFEITLRPKEA